VALKKVIVGGSVGDSWLSRAIQYFQRLMPRRRKDLGDVPSHAWAAGYSEEFGCVLVLESTRHGYRPTEWSRWLAHSRVVRAYHLRDIDMSPAIKWAGKQTGVKYEFSSIARYVWTVLVYWFTLRWTHRPENTPNAMICSEAATRFVQQVGVLEISRPEQMTPLEFIQAIEHVPAAADVTKQVQDGSWWSEFE